MSTSVIPFTFSRLADWAGEIELKGMSLTGLAFELVVLKDASAQTIPLSALPGEPSVLAFRIPNSVTRHLALGQWSGDLIQISDGARDRIGPVVVYHAKEGAR